MCEYVALLERFKQSRQVEDLRHGLMLSLFYNTNKQKEAKALQPGDFFPSLRERPEEPVNSSLGKWMMLAADLKQQQANKNNNR